MHKTVVPEKVTYNSNAHTSVHVLDTVHTCMHVCILYVYIVGWVLVCLESQLFNQLSGNTHYIMLQVHSPCMHIHSIVHVHVYTLHMYMYMYI